MATSKDDADPRLDQSAGHQPTLLHGEHNVVEHDDTREGPNWVQPARKKLLSFSPGDPKNPHNWSMRKKIIIVVIVMNSVLNSTLNSGATAGDIEEITGYYNVTSSIEKVLPVSMYLLGYVFGPLAFGPLSETYGRKLLMVTTFIFFLCFTMACPLAPNWPAFLVFRLLQGVGASCPISVVGGIYADIFADPVARGRAMACFMAATCFGPTLGPVVSGFLAPVGWKWAFWVTLIYGGVSFVPVALIPETYAPVILKRRARKLRKNGGDPNLFAPIEFEHRGAREIITVVLTRPIRMFLFEAIVLCSCLYSALVFGTFYLFFQAFPLIFQGIYGLNNGESGLAFVAIAIGGVFACLFFIYWDTVIRKARNEEKPWASNEEYRRLPLACIAGPSWVISLFWLGWTADSKVHFIVPMLAGIPCGFGYLLIFMALLNYLTDAYEIFSASALAANATSRSIFGAFLPFAAKPMYSTLGIHWATSLLGFLSIVMSIIPFVFIKYGPTIRAHSKFCQALLRTKEKDAMKSDDTDDLEKDLHLSGDVDIRV